MFYPGLGWSRGHLIYQFSGFLDVAVIHISRMPSILQKVQIWNGDYRTLRGRACCAVGFGLEERHSLRVDHTANFGNIAKVCFMLLNSTVHKIIQDSWHDFVSMSLGPNNLAHHLQINKVDLLVYHVWQIMFSQETFRKLNIYNGLHLSFNHGQVQNRIQREL